MDKELYINGSGCIDPTAGEALSNIAHEENIKKQFDVSLNNFAYTPGFYEKLRVLADMAMPEQWSVASPEHFTENRDTYLLEHHIFTTFNALFRMLQDYREKYGGDNDNIISINDKVLAFNTGLVTPLYQDIFAVFKPNPNPIKGRNWMLVGFFTDDSYEMEPVYTLPKPLRSFAVGSFHPAYSIRFNLEHMLLSPHNLERIPASLRKSPSLPVIIKYCSELSMQRERSMGGIAVSQWYDGRKQYLLPLFMVDEGTADLALTLDEKEGHYYAHTALTPEMAYSRARLLAKPEAVWLRDALNRKDDPNE